MSLVIFPAKLEAEIPRYTFDFLNVMPAGTSIYDVSITMDVFSGEDEEPELMIVGGSIEISGSRVSVLVQGGIVGVIYELTCGATIVEGEDTSGPIYQQQGKIAVLDSDPYESDDE